MRLGIFGGAFDPIHYGHLLLAESCREQARLDQVWFLPTSVAPHKLGRQATAAEAHVEMLELALSGSSSFAVCRHEIDRGGVNYTVDTLAALAATDATRELFFLIGGDSLTDFPTWRDPAGICDLATLVVAARGGQPLDFEPLTRVLSAEKVAAIRNHEVRMPAVDISSSDLRDRVASVRSIRFRTPRAVEKYIETHGLYRQSTV